MPNRKRGNTEEKPKNDPEEKPDPKPNAEKPSPGAGATDPPEGPLKSDEPYVMSDDTEYSFPSKVRCPRCRTTGSRAYATRGNTQYRTCTNSGICRHKWKVIGKRV